MMNTGRRWSSGDAVVLREVLKGRVWAARPHTVVQDDPHLTVLWQAPGTVWMRPVTARGERVRLDTRLRGDWKLVRDVWRLNTGTLRFILPGRPYSVLLFWNHDSYDSADAWYVNVEQPMRRTAFGFDYLDLLLDVVVKPDRKSWSWKDEDEFAEAIERGLIQPGEARSLRDVALQAVSDIRRSRPPYLDDWIAWRAPADWKLPGLPEGWDRLD